MSVARCCPGRSLCRRRELFGKGRVLQRAAGQFRLRLDCRHWLVCSAGSRDWSAKDRAAVVCRSMGRSRSMDHFRRWPASRIRAVQASPDEWCVPVRCSGPRLAYRGCRRHRLRSRYCREVSLKGDAAQQRRLSNYLARYLAHSVCRHPRRSSPNLQTRPKFEAGPKEGVARPRFSVCCCSTYCLAHLSVRSPLPMLRSKVRAARVYSAANPGPFGWACRRLLAQESAGHLAGVACSRLREPNAALTGNCRLAVRERTAQKAAARRRAECI
jgi:hypothetical protein